MLPGFYPDPSICRADGDYYLVTSTFEYFPGVPVFHSRDLVNWEQIGHVLDRSSQLNLDGIKCSGGIYAPTIRYHEGTFYMAATLFGRGGNFIATAKDPAGPWSDPYWLEDDSFLSMAPNSVIPWVDRYFTYESEPCLFANAPGIDPSLFFDDDGRIYYTGNRKPERGGRHWSDREIWLQELDLKTMKLKGEKHALWQGAGGAFTEGSHIYKVDGYYYLLVAEGGTFHNHAVTVARSKSVTGPYEGSPMNPVLTHRHLGLDHPIVNVGHADMVQTQNGEWWMVVLASRPFGGYHTNLGRETFLVPVRWEDGWPVASPGSGRVESSFSLPSLPGTPRSFMPACENFEQNSLAFHWNFLRTPRGDFWSTTERPGYLRLRLKPQTATAWENPSLVCRRRQHMDFCASAAMEFAPENGNEEAGLILMQNNYNLFRFVYTSCGSGVNAVKLIRHCEGVQETVFEKKADSKRLYLKIEARGQDLDFYYAAGDGAGWAWREAAAKQDGRFLSPQAAGGFTGSYIGMYASSNGVKSGNHADFDWFEYIGG